MFDSRSSHTEALESQSQMTGNPISQGFTPNNHEGHNMSDDPQDTPRARRAQAAEEKRRLDQAEVDRMATEYLKKLPPTEALLVGAIYARYSTDHQSSTVDQVRACLEAALTHKITVPRENICFDIGVSGATRRRPGFDRLLNLIEGKRIGVLLAVNSSRLHRVGYRLGQFIQEELVERKIRLILPFTGLDTDRQGWKTMVPIQGIMDENAREVHVHQVRGAQVGLFDHGFVVGKLCYGYQQEVVPESGVTRKGRPRSRPVIDSDAAKIVREIFQLFVHEHKPINEIARILNTDSAIPLNPNATLGAWTPLVVRRILANERYCGVWSYGVTETQMQLKKDYAKKVQRNEPIRRVVRETLRIVDEKTWLAAQKRLKGQCEHRGRHAKGGNRQRRPKLLNGLIHCPTHDVPLYVGGGFGYTMYCPRCALLPAEDRAIFTTLNRALAFRLTCQAIARHLQNDRELVARIVKSCQIHVERQGRPDPKAIPRLRDDIARYQKSIDLLVDSPGETEDDMEISKTRLQEYRQRQRGAREEIARLTNAEGQPKIVPTPVQVREAIADLSRLLGEAEGQGRARDLIEILTGGRIDVEQCGDRKAHRGWLRGRFRLHHVRYLESTMAGVPISEPSTEPEIVVDFRERTKPEEYANEVHRLEEAGHMIAEIATMLGIDRNMVRKAQKEWYSLQGLDAPDGRTRRAGLERKQLKAPRYVVLSDQVKELFEQGRELQSIAKEVGLDKNNVTRSFHYWYESRGLPVPSTRRARGSRLENSQSVSVTATTTPDVSV